MKDAEIYLGYFKQGDDLHHYLENTDNVLGALQAHSEMLIACANHLQKIKEEISADIDNIEIFSDCHYIGISGPDHVIDRLVEAKLVTLCDYEEEEVEND